MAAGKWLLDSIGRFILDATGKRQLSDGVGDGCCCGKKCFQLWTAVWDCDTSAWTLTPGGFSCLPTGTSTAWSGSGCTYTRYVATTTDCTVDGDCTGHADTATPAAPNGGAEPAGCCTPASDCTECSFVGSSSPQHITVSFSGVTIAAAPCDALCVYGTFSSSGTLGTYTLHQDPLDACHWFYEGTGPSFTTYETYDTGPPCTTGGTTATYNVLRIDLHVHGTGSWKLTASTEGPGFETDPTGYLWFYSDSDPGPPDCCTAFDVTNIYTFYGCDNPGIGGTATITPTC